MNHPKSATNASVSLFASCVIWAIFIFLTGKDFNPIPVMIGLGLIYILTVLIYDLFVGRVWRNPSTGLTNAWKGVCIKRVTVKLLAFFVTMAFLWLTYRFFIFYQTTHHAHFCAFFDAVFPWILLLSVPYIIAVDGFMKEPRDSLWEFGQILLFRWKNRQWEMVKKHLLEWGLKLYFIPFLFSLLYISTQSVSEKNLTEAISNPYQFFSLLFASILFLDILIGMIGYVFTFRVFDTHIRSVNSYSMGWIVTLLCYPPLSSIILNSYFNYSNELQWHQWLGHDSPLFFVFAAVILISTAIFAYSTICFGLRFSNLTNRGIVTGGIYRWVKHPAYLSKNISWWFISIPFISTTSSLEAIVSCMQLAFINWIYYMRARFEEQHLMQDPEYQAYAKWVEQHGLFSKFSRTLLAIRNHSRRAFAFISARD